MQVGGCEYNGMHDGVSEELHEMDWTYDATYSERLSLQPICLLC